MTQEQAVKKVTYTPEGILHEESDLLELPPPAIVYNGPSLTYRDNGSVEKILLYKQDQLNGPAKTFYSHGALQHLETYHSGVLDGPTEAYHDNGKLAETGFYKEGKRHGRLERFYDNGSRAGVFLYENGLLEGEASEWYEDGSLQALYFYHRGLLQGDRKHIALTRYFPDRNIAETQDFRSGVPVGLHTQYYPGGENPVSRQLRKRP